MPKQKEQTKIIDTITIQGQKIRYALFGPEDADRTLLVFNGIGASLDAVAPVASMFERTRILTFDVPGVGGSPTPLIPYRFSWLSRMTARLLDQLGIGEVDVAGVSWGGAAAQQFTYDHQGRVNSLTLCATSAGMVMIPGNIQVLRKMATPKRYMDPEHMMNIGPDIYGGQLRMNRELLDMHAGSLKAGDARGYLYQLLCGIGWTSWLWLPQIEVPTLLLMGGDDPLIPVVNGKILMNRLPDARMVVMDCGHLFILSKPHETAQRIEAFIHDGVVLDAEVFDDDSASEATPA
ncbi:MAG: poly(3-hydroxyalkanoate) depolymerase [Pseudomonadota bacterium]